MNNSILQLLNVNAWMIDIISATNYITLLSSQLQNSGFPVTATYSDSIKGIERDICGTYFFNNNPKFQIDLIPSSNSNIQYNEGNKVAFYAVVGTIHANSYSYPLFSTREFEKAFIRAENNDSIIGHYIYLDSPGGEAHRLDLASKLIAESTKPVVAHFERICASAAYYLIAGASRIFATSPHDRVGSIGTMISVLDLIPILEKLGAQKIEAYASASFLKNAKENELLSGNPERFVREVLDPINESFTDFVKSQRKKITSFIDKGILNGETFNAVQSKEYGLIDGIRSVQEALDTVFILSQTR